MDMWGGSGGHSQCQLVATHMDTGMARFVIMESYGVFITAMRQHARHPPAHLMIGSCDVIGSRSKYNSNVAALKSETVIMNLTFVQPANESIE